LKKSYTKKGAEISYKQSTETSYQWSDERSWCRKVSHKVPKRLHLLWGRHPGLWCIYLATGDITWQREILLDNGRYMFHSLYTVNTVKWRMLAIVKSILRVANKYFRSTAVLLDVYVLQFCYCSWRLRLMLQSTILTSHSSVVCSVNAFLNQCYASNYTCNMYLK
jgi:hypothetical protein